MFLVFNRIWIQVLQHQWSGTQLPRLVWSYIGSFVTFMTLEDFTSFVSTSHVCPDQFFKKCVNLNKNHGFGSFYHLILFKSCFFSSATAFWTWRFWLICFSVFKDWRVLVDQSNLELFNNTPIPENVTDWHISKLYEFHPTFNPAKWLIEDGWIDWTNRLIDY